MLLKDASIWFKMIIVKRLVKYDRPIFWTLC